MEPLHRLVDLFGVELAGLARLDELGGVLKHCGPVKTTAKGLTSEGARRGVVPAIPSVDVGE